jgi:hypothetical protein
MCNLKNISDVPIFSMLMHSMLPATHKMTEQKNIWGKMMRQKSVQVHLRLRACVCACVCVCVRVSDEKLLLLHSRAAFELDDLQVFAHLDVGPLFDSFFSLSLSLPFLLSTHTHTFYLFSSLGVRVLKFFCTHTHKYRHWRHILCTHLSQSMLSLLRPLSFFWLVSVHLVQPLLYHSLS